MKRGETTANNIKLGTLVKFSETNNNFELHDIQYDIIEFFNKSQIKNSYQLMHMKVVQFKAIEKDLIHVDVVE